jgi:chitodextrinase
MAEFKISRLRFTWVGEWLDQNVYNTDEVVQYEGKAYLCLEPHTSNGFYSDLGATVPKWELMMTGQTWKGPWQQFTAYSLDNIVIFGGIVYKCNTQHISNTVLDNDIEKWDVYAESKSWQSEWTSTTTYGVGDIVQYGGTAYECVISHISAGTDLEGLEADYVGLDSTLVKWKVSKPGVQWRGEYATSTADSSILRYKLDDLVKYGASVYKCIEGHSPSAEFVDFADSTELYETFQEAKWELWLPGLDFGGVWDSNAVYQPGDVVIYGGYLYQSLTINNINSKPSFNSGDSTDNWELVTKAWDVSAERL